MATFSFPKSVNDILEAVLLPVDWYLCRISAEPEIKENKAKREGGEDADKAGDNLVLILHTIHDTPEFNGRRLMKYLPWPKAGDENEFPSYCNGQSLLDHKMDDIATWVDAFGGSLDGQDIELTSGLEGQVMVIQEPDNRSGELVNSVDFNSSPKQA